MATDPRFDGAGPDSGYWTALAAGRLVVARCRACGLAQPAGRLVCAACGAAPLAQVPASGKGTVYSTTAIRRRAEQGGDYNVAIVELAEGVRLMSRVEGVAADQVRIGMAVQARIAGSGDAAVLVFDPLAGDA